MKQQTEAGKKTIRIWDWPIRLFHWLLVTLVVVSWVTAEIGGNAMQYHMWSGYAILSLVLFRIMWGFVGSDTARFAHFLRGPRVVFGYLRNWFTPHYRAVLGHNPLGGWSAAALVFVLLFQASTGLFSNDDIAAEGPLYHLVSKALSDALTQLHQISFNVLLALIGMHVAAIILYRVKHRENLLTPMLTGDKTVDAGAPEFKQSSAWLALALVIAAAGVVYGIVTKL